MATADDKTRSGPVEFGDANFYNDELHRGSHRYCDERAEDPEQNRSEEHASSSGKGNPKIKSQMYVRTPAPPR